MSATTSVRHLVQAAIMQLLDKKLTGVQLLDGVELRDLKDEAIVIGDVASIAGGIANMKPGRKQRRDDFIFDIHIRAGKQGQKTPAVAKARAAELLAALEDVLADNATVDGITHSTELVAFEGPNAFPLEGKTFAAEIDAHVKCVSQQI